MDVLPALVLPKNDDLILVQIKCKVLLVTMPEGLFYFYQIFKYEITIY